jgi:serine/tyrosine/threonine adenylyltransferase
MRAKLGLFNEETEDLTLIKDLLNLMQKHRADYTNTFRALTFDETEDTALFRSQEFAQWREQWHTRLTRQPEPKSASHQLMRNNNPALIPRNHRVEEALEAAVNGDKSVMNQLLKALSNPFAHSPEQDEYCTLPPESSQPYRTYCGT